MKFFVGLMIGLSGYLPLKLFSQGTIEQAKLETHVRVLASDSLMGRLTGTEGIQMAARYISGVMAGIGLEPFDPVTGEFLVPWNRQEGKRAYFGNNIAGLVRGSLFPDSIIIISAHYDHIGDISSQKKLAFRAGYKRVKGDSIFNGANDNATGISAMLELAKAFKQAKPSFSLLFVAFSGEELGLFGSEAFVKLIDPERVVLNINLEMLGRPGKSEPFVTEPEEGSAFLNNLNENLKNAGPQYSNHYFNKDTYPGQGLFNRSDNYPFYKAGIPAYTIMGTNPHDKYYHSPDDEAATIQFEAMTKMVNAVYLALLPIVKPNHH